MKGTVKKMRVMVNTTQKKNNHDIPFIYVYVIMHIACCYITRMPPLECSATTWFSNL